MRSAIEKTLWLQPEGRRFYAVSEFQGDFRSAERKVNLSPIRCSVCLPAQTLGGEDAGVNKIRERQKDTEVERLADENTVFIGKKPTMNYVLAVVTQFNSGNGDVVIKARGQAISRAVDVAEISRNRFITNAVVKEIRISTESLTNEEGRTSNVSSIEIFLVKK